LNRFVPAHLHRSKNSKPLPIVRCPGCKTAMVASHPKELPRVSNLQEITYTCPSCGMTTKRTIKAAS
jgi:C4-type Zn-finger protein